MVNKVKRSALAVLVGSGVIWSLGCLGDSWWSETLWDAAVYTGLEYMTDNDAFYDLWEDGTVVVED